LSNSDIRSTIVVDLAKPRLQAVSVTAPQKRGCATEQACRRPERSFNEEASTWREESALQWAAAMEWEQDASQVINP